MAASRSALITAEGREKMIKQQQLLIKFYKVNESAGYIFKDILKGKNEILKISADKQDHFYMEF